MHKDTRIVFSSIEELEAFKPVLRSNGVIIGGYASESPPYIKFLKNEIKFGPITTEEYLSDPKKYYKESPIKENLKGSFNEHYRNKNGYVGD